MPGRANSVSSYADHLQSRTLVHPQEYYGIYIYRPFKNQPTSLPWLVFFLDRSHSDSDKSNDERIFIRSQTSLINWSTRRSSDRALLSLPLKIPQSIEPHTTDDRTQADRPPISKREDIL